MHILSNSVIYYIHSCLQGESTTSVILQVLADATPEIPEPYTVNITSVETLSTDISSRDGVAILDQTSSTATITIRASDNPHGIVEFQSSSLDVLTDESAMLELTIIRTFGTIGKYSLINSNLIIFL